MGTPIDPTRRFALISLAICGLALGSVVFGCEGNEEQGENAPLSTPAVKNLGIEDVTAPPGPGKNPNGLERQAIRPTQIPSTPPTPRLPALVQATPPPAITPTPTKPTAEPTSTMEPARPAAVVDSPPVPAPDNENEEFNFDTFCVRGGAWQGQDLLRWTPDGTRIVTEHRGQLYVIEADGSYLRPITRVTKRVRVRDSWVRVGWMTYFDVSPDGADVVFSTCTYQTESTEGNEATGGLPRVGGYRYEIGRTDIAGGSVQRITENHASDNYPAWSPDGTRIALISRDPTFEHITYIDSPHASSSINFIQPAGTLITMSPDGSSWRDLAPDIPESHFIAYSPPVWSPKGDRLAFTLVHDTVIPAEVRAFIYTINADGSELKKIAETLSVPAWSPDGSQIAHVRAEPDGIALYVMDSDGENPRALAEAPHGYPRFRHPHSGVWVGTVAWSPDGTRILFTCGTDVCVVGTDGTVVAGDLMGVAGVDRHLFEDSQGDSSADWLVPAWSPDGSRIAVVKNLRKTLLRTRYRRGTVLLYTQAPDGTDVRVLARADDWDELIPEKLAEDETQEQLANCSEGIYWAKPDPSPGSIRDCVALINLSQHPGWQRTPGLGFKPVGHHVLLGGNQGGTNG